jgi:hypothetical protein
VLEPRGEPVQPREAAGPQAAWAPLLGEAAGPAAQCVAAESELSAEVLAALRAPAESEPSAAAPAPLREAAGADGLEQARERLRDAQEHLTSVQPV